MLFILLGPHTGTLDTVAVGCTTFATLLVIEVALSVLARARNASISTLNFCTSVSNSWHLKEKQTNNL